MIKEIQRKRSNSTYHALVAKSNSGEVKTLGFKTSDEKKEAKNALSLWLEAKDLKRGRGRPPINRSLSSPRLAITAANSLFKRVDNDRQVSHKLVELGGIVKEIENLVASIQRDARISEHLRSL